MPDTTTSTHDYAVISTQPRGFTAWARNCGIPDQFANAPKSRLRPGQHMHTDRAWIPRFGSAPQRSKLAQANCPWTRLAGQISDGYLVRHHSFRPLLPLLLRASDRQVQYLTAFIQKLCGSSALLAPPPYPGDSDPITHSPIRASTPSSHRYDTSR
ncbi:hypothetical protein AG1IA_02339 [Rhizoctonia solani AG-1 IA]|uniref:Uncharacterized protein n=1 Tax=Thanatephorus cucumeris (strain AG1-IA) TaxID=983506 RepID=L8X3P4_THACA|nr:hypothetical protein AG1IA_02339 [Rhizoctonia solani AG-1 IA]